jgi:2-dehydro-3-deoxyglucarate aldolase/4-hydroxy-2-oxoheptanedioate aldolase
MSASLRAKLRDGEPTLGTFLSLGCPLAAEACAAGGFEWVLVDLEHGAGGEQALTGQIHAAAAHGVPAIVRVETAERIRSGRVLDAGAAGVMFPRLDSAEEAAEAMRHLRYPPAGDRGVATYNRSCAFGLDPGALDTANDAVIGIVQIETLSALDGVEAIAATPDVDVLFVGPRDLSHALGVPGRFDAPAYREALSRVLAAARDAGVAAGVLAANRAAAEAAVADGFTFVVVGSDANLLATAARDAAAPISVPAGT